MSLLEAMAMDALVVATSCLGGPKGVTAGLLTGITSSARVSDETLRVRLL